MECIYHLCGVNNVLIRFSELFTNYKNRIGLSEENLVLHNIELFEDYQKVKRDLCVFLRKGNRNLTVAAFYRLIVFDNIPMEEDQDRFVYLDTDTICNGDISLLGELDFSDNLVAAVPDFPYQLKYARTKLNFKGDNYFNSGFMVINARLWSKEKISQKIMQILIDTMPKQLDQDVLNIACSNRFLWLSGQLNSITNDSNEPCRDAVIIHYTGADKPWKPWRASKPSVEIYRRYLSIMEPDSHLWFDTDGSNSQALSHAGSIHDFKMLSRLCLQKHRYSKAIYWWVKHLIYKVRRKGILFVLLGK